MAVILSPQLIKPHPWRTRISLSNAASIMAADGLTVKAERGK